MRREAISNTRAVCLLHTGQGLWMLAVDTEGQVPVGMDQRGSLSLYQSKSTSQHQIWLKEMKWVSTSHQRQEI